MKKTIVIFIIMLLLPLSALAASQKIVQIGVNGMTCQFCVYGVQKKLKKSPNEQRVQVSLKLRVARITYKPGVEPNLDQVKAAIKAAGYTAGQSKVITRGVSSG